MGKGCLDADLAAADLDGDDRFIHRAAGFHKGFRRIQAFDIDRDTLRVFIFVCISDELAEIHIGLVSQTDEEAHAEMVFLGCA